MLIVITGLDGSGTSSIAKGLANIDKNSMLFKTPCPEFSDRDKIDEIIRKDSKVGHMLYYLASTVYISDYIKNHCDYVNNNVYVVRYLIDTVVSNRVAGIPIDLNYNIYGNQILKPDLTIFITLDESIREYRISNRGKSCLDKVLDDNDIRNKFLIQFENLLEKDRTIYVDNGNYDLNTIVDDTYEEIKQFSLKPNYNDINI